MSVEFTVDDEAFKKLISKLEQASIKRVKIGVFSGTGEREGGITGVELAAIHEFGSPAAGIPQRSFIRSTFENNKPDVARITGQLASKIIKGANVAQAYAVLGTWATAQVKNTIVSGGGHASWKPLAAETIARKGSSSPLIDTGRLLSSITWEIE